MSAQLDELIGRWLDGSADPEAIRALDAQLRHDRAAAARFVTLAELDLALHRRREIAAAGSDLRRRRMPRTRRPRRRRARPIPLALGGGLTAVAALVLALLLGRTPPTAAPAVWLGADGRPVAPHRILAAGPAGLVLQRSDEPTRVTVAPGGRLRIADHARLDLALGELRVVAAPQRPGRQLVIATPQATATVVGTAFTLRVEEGRTRLQVREGTVRFAPPAGAPRLVHAGEEALLPPMAPAHIETPEPAVPELAITGFVLIDAGTDRPIRALEDGDVIDLAALPTRELNVVIETSGPVGSVAARIDGRVIQNNDRGYENTAPFSLVGDNAAGFHAWTPEVGVHELSATPYAADDGGGERGATRRIAFTVRDGDAD